MVEVVLALGICTLALVALVGLFGIGLQTTRDSEDEIQAANLTSLLISTCTASPASTLTNRASPPSAMSQAYGDAYQGVVSYVGYDGKLTTASRAAYQITCQAGTNSVTGQNLAQIYLKLSWPPQLDPADAKTKRYEVLTYIPLH
jgi:uncharacterized protein (TIGR02598 family)